MVQGLFVPCSAPSDRFSPERLSIVFRRNASRSLGSVEPSVRAPPPLASSVLLPWFWTRVMPLLAAPSPSPRSAGFSVRGFLRLLQVWYPPPNQRGVTCTVGRG